MLARAWTVAQALRARRGWRLDNAFVERFWSARFGAAAFEVSAHMSLFFEPPRPDRRAFVLQVVPSFPKGTPPATVDEASRQLRSSLGERYGRIQGHPALFAKVMTDKPRHILAEIAHVEHALTGRAATPVSAGPRSPDHRLWHIVEALRASSWLISSLSFSRMIGDERRALHASINVTVDAARGRGGLGATIGSWTSRTNKRWTRFCATAATGLAADGFRVDEQSPQVFHAGASDRGSEQHPCFDAGGRVRSLARRRRRGRRVVRARLMAEAAKVGSS